MIYIDNDITVASLHRTIEDVNDGSKDYSNFNLTCTPPRTNADDMALSFEGIQEDNKFPTAGKAPPATIPIKILTVINPAAPLP